MKKQHGFTLVELLVVIAVVGILLGIGVVAFHSAQNTARRRADEATVRVLNSATMMLAISEGKSLETVFQEPSSSPDKLEDLVDRNALESVPDPAQPGVAFVWDTDALRWFLGFLVHVITTADGISWHTNGLWLLGPYTGSATDILIPDFFEGIEVTQIYQNSFANSGLASVTFGDSSKITTIHARAFQNNNLTSIDLPGDLKEIHTRAFLNNAISELNIPMSVTLVQNHAFANNNIASLSLGSNVQIWDFVFEHNPITKITIGSNVTIGNPQSFGIHGASFKTFYEANDRAAGTYVWNGSNWGNQ